MRTCVVTWGWCWLVAIWLLGGLVSCGPKEEGSEGGAVKRGIGVEEVLEAAVKLAGGDLKVGDSQLLRVLIADGRVPFHRAQVQYLQYLAAAEMEVRVEFLDALGDGARQLEQLEAQLLDAPGAVMVMPVDFAAAAGYLAGLKKVGVLVALVDPVDGDSEGWAKAADVVVRCDGAEAGGMMGRYVVRALEKRALQLGHSVMGGRVVILRGADKDAWGWAYQQGVDAVLAKSPGVKVVHDAPTDWDAGQVAARLAEAVRLQVEFDVLLCHDDFLAAAAHEAAVKAETREGQLVLGVNGFLGVGGGREMIAQGILDASVERPFLVNEALRLLLERMRGGGRAEGEGAVVQLQPRLLTPMDVD